MTKPEERRKLVVAEPLGVPEKEIREALRLFTQAGHELVIASGKPADTEATVRLCADADYVILANMPFPDAVVDACPKLRFVDVAFTGVDHVGMNACRRRGIRVCNASGYATRAVSEQALCMFLSLLRALPAMDRETRLGHGRNGFAGREAAGKTCGIVGLGAIGLATAHLLEAFGCRVVGTSATQTSGEREGIPMLPLADVLGMSDAVFLHCPLRDTTRGLIREETIAQMKDGALLLNLARGPVVDTPSVIAALESGKLSGYASDVFDREPPLDPEDPILHAPNTLFMPHTGYATQEAMRMRLDMVVENLMRYLSGDPCRVVL